MTKYNLEMTKNGETTTKTSGSRLDLIMEVRHANPESAVIRNPDCSNKAVFIYNRDEDNK